MKPGGLSMADRIAMFNKNKTESKPNSQSTQPQPVKQVIEEVSSPNQIRINEVKDTNLHSLSKTIEKPEVMKLSDSNSHKGKIEKSIEPMNVKSSTAQFDLKLEKPAMIKGKSEKVFGMSNQLENRFKMMGMPAPKKVEQAKSEIQEEEEDDFFKTKARSQSLATGPQLKLVEIKISQTEIMDMKPSIKDKKKKKKPNFDAIQEVQEIQESQEEIDFDDVRFDGRNRTSTC